MRCRNDFDASRLRFCVSGYRRLLVGGIAWLWMTRVELMHGVCYYWNYCKHLDVVPVLPLVCPPGVYADRYYVGGQVGMNMGSAGRSRRGKKMEARL